MVGRIGQVLGMLGEPALQQVEGVHDRLRRRADRGREQEAGLDDDVLVVGPCRVQTGGHHLQQAVGHVGLGDLAGVDALALLAVPLQRRMDELLGVPALRLQGHLIDRCAVGQVGGAHPGRDRAGERAHELDALVGVHVAQTDELRGEVEEDALEEVDEVHPNDAVGIRGLAPFGEEPVRLRKDDLLTDAGERVGPHQRVEQLAPAPVRLTLVEHERGAEELADVDLAVDRVGLDTREQLRLVHDGTLGAHQLRDVLQLVHGGERAAARAPGALDEFVSRGCSF